MLIKMGDRKNEEKHSRKRRFKRDFPNKSVVEARINAAIDGAANLAELKRNLKKIFNGGGGEPGIVGALFNLER